MASYVFMPDGIEVRVALLSEGMMLSRFTWKDYVKVVGPHSLNGRYSKVMLNVHGKRVVIEFARKDNNSIVGRVKPLEAYKNLDAIFIFHNPYRSEYGSIKILNDRTCMLSGPLNACLTLSESSRWGIFPHIGSAHAYLSLHKVLPNKICGLPYIALFQNQLKKELFFSSSCSSSSEFEIAEQCKSLIKEARIILEEAAESYKEETPNVKGLWEGIEEGVRRALAWNIIWDAEKNRIICPVSRNWAYDWGGWVLFDWDTFFTALLASFFNKDLAYKIAASILDEVTEEGFVPNYSSPSGKTIDRSQPPVGSYCILKLHKIHPNHEFLKEAYPKLKRWHTWWIKNRDCNKDGLLEWGTGRGKVVRAPAFTDSSAGTLAAALFESGLDNSPMYDDVSLIECRNDCKVMNLTDVGLNALYALDSWALSIISKEIGISSDSEVFEEEYEDLKRKMNNVLWCEELGIYLNKYWNGEFSRVLSPTLFYPLLAGIVPLEKARRMIKEHLLDEKEFWGEYVIPSVSRNHSSFEDQEYWRGRIWAPMNYLVAEGLRRYGFYDVSFSVSEKSLKLFLKEWREETHVHENYNATSGEGDDVISSEPVYTWGALLGYLPIQEIVDVEIWGGFKFGTPYMEGDVSVEGYNIGGNLYDIYLSNNGLKVLENGKEILKSNTPLLVRNYKRSEDSVEFNVISSEEKVITLVIGNLEGSSYEVRTGSKIMKMKTKEGKISIQIPITPKGLDIKILRV